MLIHSALASYRFSNRIENFLDWFQVTPIAWLFSFVLVMVLIETYVRKKEGFLSVRQETQTSVIMGFAYLFVKVIGGKLLFFGIAVYIYTNFALFNIPANIPILWIALYLLGDFTYYWIHRAEHRFKLLWSSHLIHHSSEDFSFATAVRNPWTEIFYKPLLGLWAPLLGVHPLMSAAMGTVGLMVGLLQHTMLIKSLGPLDKILMTPKNHRVHHAKNVEYLDKNFGGTFIIWDQLFGTYLDEMEAPVYGITKPLKDKRAWTVAKGGFPELFSNIKSEKEFRNKISVLFSRP